MNLHSLPPASSHLASQRTACHIFTYQKQPTLTRLSRNLSHTQSPPLSCNLGLTRTAVCLKCLKLLKVVCILLHHASVSRKETERMNIWSQRLTEKRNRVCCSGGQTQHTLMQTNASRTANVWVNHHKILAAKWIVDLICGFVFYYNRSNWQ